jgi:hypothetical protein
VGGHRREVHGKGRLTIGGSKETAYAVYAALKDTNSPGYKKVRGL